MKPPFSQIEIEEFKYTADRKKEFENRANQILFFCISSFGVIFGFSGRIPEEIIPYLLVSILFITVSRTFELRTLQNFTAAYVARKFYNNSDISYEALYNVVANKRNKRNVLKNLFYNPFPFTGPVSLLYYCSLFSSFYFGRAMYYEDYSPKIKIIYFSGLFILHLLIILLKVKTAKYSYTHFEKIITEQFPPDPGEGSD